MTVAEKTFINNNINKITSIEEILASKNWNIVHKEMIEAKKGIYFDYDDLDLSFITKSFLKKSYPNGIYEHQRKTIKKYLQGADVCIATSTSSGKTLAFQTCALDTLIKNSDAKIIAIYPTKALGSEQEEKWNKAFLESGVIFKIGKIDGSVDGKERTKIIEESSVLIMTPDVIHAWLLSTVNLEKRVFSDFIKNISLIIVDEAHAYSGVFGSNSAYLFRRLQHLNNLLGGKIRFIAASATIKNPEIHLCKLFGKSFVVIGLKYESSPKQKSKILFLDMPSKNEGLSSISDLLGEIIKQTDNRFITFVESRKKAEYMAKFVLREGVSKDLISPYRSGYEDSDRKNIQKKLTEGSLKGVISTSALEMGIDIPHLDICILLGVPASKTSLFQRIGRVGRHKEGLIIIINDGSIHSQMVFKDCAKLFDLPLVESTLYLENKKIQYINALCLARNGGEHDIIAKQVNKYEDEFFTQIHFPENFDKICIDERLGQINSECIAYKELGGDEPNRVFPLRSIDTQFKIENQSNPFNERGLGDLAMSQVMLESYPGAVYYYCTDAYRVNKIHQRDRLISVKQEKSYFTEPLFFPLNIYPNITDNNVYTLKKYNELKICESKITVKQTIYGYKEKRGSSPAEKITYPIPTYNKPTFSNNIITTGMMFFHPIFNEKKLDLNVLASLIYEAFLLLVPLEKRDVGFGFDQYRTNKNLIQKGDKFIIIFDQIYGSLRLTSKLANEDILKVIFQKALEISYENIEQFEEKISEVLRDAIRTIINELKHEPENITLTNDEIVIKKDEIKVIAESSFGIVAGCPDQEFFILRHHSVNNVLMYIGSHNKEDLVDPRKCISRYPVDKILPLEGFSKMALYNIELGFTTEIID